MRPQIDHNIDPSIFLWLDYLLIERNEAFQNFTGEFRATSSLISGFNSYSAPHRQFVYDSSVSGATVPSGVSASGVFVPTGATIKLDFYRGQVVTTTTLTQPVSGVYSYKEVNLYFADSSDKSILFENKYDVNPRSQPKYEDYDAKNLSYPCIFIKSCAGVNEAICFDGCESTVMEVRLILLAENLYQYKAITSILRDRKNTHMAIFNPEELPFDEFYSLRNGPFDYSSSVNTIQTDSNRLAFVKNVSISDFTDRVNMEIGPRVFGGFIDLELELLRFPHS